ncbi:hypothetical protein HRbin21_00089 [bacterium HR21]|nr:hypothetical protein HRbin21_00089 [bacterium HR21]
MDPPFNTGREQRRERIRGTKIGALSRARPQHRGRMGSDTLWLHVPLMQLPDWLQSSGGSVETALSVLEHFLREAAV